MFYNPVTNNEYSGKNTQILTEARALMGIEDFEVAGFKQWLEVGRCVQKGQRGTRILMACDKKIESSDEKKKVFKGRTVFFKSQTAPIDQDKPVDEKPNNESPAKSNNPQWVSDKKAEVIYKIASNMEKSIDDKFSDRLTNTPKRLAQAMWSRLEGERLKRTHDVLIALGDLIKLDNLPEILKDIKINKTSIYGYMGEATESVPNGFYSYSVGTGKPAYSDPVTTALWALLKPKSEQEKKADQLRELENGLQFSSIPGFFPTPKAVIDIMLDRADLWAGMNCLEPSAGNGQLADAIKTRIGIANISTVEINNTLANILKVKGYDPINDDFLKAHFGQRFDRILMNPPFEKLQDVDHVQHAFKFLGDNGILVSIMSPGPFFRSDKKSTAFREWLDSLSAEVIDLPEGSFKESGTNVATKLIVINKD